MWRKLLCLISVMVLSAGIACAGQDTTYGWAGIGQPGQAASSGLSASTGLPASALPGRFAPVPGSDQDLLQGMQDDARLKMEAEGKGFELRNKQEQKRPQVTVFVEPGDGLIKLSWKILNLALRSDEQALQYLLRVGTEPEKPARSMQVGKLQEYVLRDLKNFQPYYLQVVAMDKEQQVLYKSEEIRVVPVPADQLGSNLERSFARQTATLLDAAEPEKLNRELKQFGYDFFRNSAQLLQATDLLPASDEYRLGPGDSLKLSIWGAINVQQELTIDRNGELLIPKVGSVKLWGLGLEQAKDALHAALARYYKNFELSLSVGRLRTIQVYLVGEVAAPGSYPVSSMATVINALAAAGGPSRNGSLRSVRVTRGSQQLAVVDLYDMLLQGDRSKDLRLQNGDTIFVPVIGPVAAVAGEVRRPAIYELKGATSLQDLLKMAGGITAGGDIGRIQIERLADNKQRVVQDVAPGSAPLDELAAGIAVRDLDMIKVFPVQSAVRQVVSLKGNVLRPGEYQFKPGMRLLDLIRSSHELLPESFMDAVEITRLTPPDFRRELLTANLRKALSGSEPDNIQLQEQDTIKVFSRWEMEEKPKVAVNGAVVNPGVYQYYPGMSVRDLVAAGGSAKRNAFMDQAELSRIRISGDKAAAERFDLNLGKALAGDPQHNLVLQPDDVLIVRSVADWSDATDKFVLVKGEVRFPGVYTVARGERLSSVIERAGGYTAKAYLFGARFTRRTVQEQQQKRMEEVIQRAEREISRKQAALASISASKEELDATKATLEGLMKSLDQMKRLKAEGRVVLRLSQLDEMKAGSYDIELEGGDELEIPQRPGVVHVLGQVYNQTSFVYLQDVIEVEEYLNKAGGPTNDADQSEIYIIRADGSVFSRQQSSFGVHVSEDDRNWTFGGFMATPLMPGDTVVVPQKIDRTAWMREIKDITQILANVAMTAGSVYLWFK